MLFSGQFTAALTYVTNELDLDRFPLSIVPVFPLGGGGGAGVVNVLVDAPEHSLLVDHGVGAPFALLIEEQVVFIAVLVDRSTETTVLHKSVLTKIQGESKKNGISKIKPMPFPSFRKGLDR